MEIIHPQIGYEEYMKNVRQAWMKEDVKQAHRNAIALKETWMGIVCGLKADPSFEFQEIANNIKILIEQIEEYGDKKCID